jgi:arginyl-tRNA synthetase
MSGRKGLGVKADDLLDTLIEKAGGEVVKRNPEFSAADTQRVARQLAVAAVRYFMIKFSRGKVIAFDLAEALSFEGESGPYIQYAVVRANNILSKLAQRFEVDEAGLVASLDGLPPAELEGGNGSHEVWSLALEAARLDEVVEQVVRTSSSRCWRVYAFSVAVVQRLLPPRADSRRGTDTPPRARRRGLRPRPAHASAHLMGSRCRRG